jgi:O-antigen/teichoic acid export membrane protein
MKYTGLGKNAFLYAVGIISIRAAAFLLIPIYTYSMSVADYGLLSVLLQTAQIMMIMIGMGSRTALMRFAKEYEDKGEIGLLIGSTILINLSGAVAVTAVSALPLLPMFRGVLHNPNPLRFVLLTCAAASSNCLANHLLGYYRAENKGLNVTLSTIAAAVSLIGLTAVFLRVLRLGIQGALIAQTIVYGALAVFLLTFIAARNRLRVSLPLSWKVIKFGLPLIVVVSGSLITQGTAFYFLSHFAGLEQVGIYSLGMKIALAVEMVLILPLQMAYEPFVYRQKVDERLWNAITRLLTYSTVTFAFTAAAVAFVARDLLPWIAPPVFGSAYPIIFLILPALAFRSVYYIGESLLLLDNRTDLAATIVSGFTLASIFLNYFFISWWGIYGAACAMSLTVAGTGIAAMKLGLRRAPLQLEKDRLLVASLLLLGFLSVVYTFHAASSYLYYTVVPATVLAAIVLLYISKFLREDERHVIQSLLLRSDHGC